MAGAVYVIEHGKRFGVMIWVSGIINAIYAEMLFRFFGR